MSNPDEHFVDLKEKKVNIAGHVIQPSDVQPRTAHSSTNEVPITSQKQYPQGKQPVPKGFATHPTLDNLNQLPDPTFTPEEKSKTKVSAATTDKSTKTFTEGPSVPLTDEANAKEFGVDLKKNTSKETFDVPAKRYTRGTVKYTGVRALEDMVNGLRNRLDEETGCIVDKTCVPESDCYEENVHFVRRKCLGRGSYGVVSLCQDKKTQEQFVIKQVPKNKLRSSEILVPVNLKHLNLTKFYGLIQRYGKDKGNPTMELLLEYCGLSIKEYYKQNRVLTDAQKWEVSKQGCAGLDHMSSNNIVHLDIKPENICIDVWADGSVVVKLTDFGSSRRLLEEPLKFVGLTPGYLAPEVCKMLLQRQSVRKLDITGKVDTFAFGLVIMFLYKGYHILVKFIDNGKQSLSQMQMKLIKLMADSRTEFVHDLIPDECDFKMKFLLRELTLLNHHDRFSAQQALGYIEEIAKDSMESENDPVEKRTKGAPGMELNPFKKCLSITEGNAPISLNNVSPQTHQMSEEFTCIRPKVRKTRANDIDSLGRKATIKPEVSLKMPQKLAKEQEMVKQYASTVQQEIRQKRVEEVNFLTGQTKKMKTFGNSPLQMDVQEEEINEEEEEKKASALPNFSMLL